MSQEPAELAPQPRRGSSFLTSVQDCASVHARDTRAGRDLRPDDWGVLECDAGGSASLARINHSRRHFRFGGSGRCGASTAEPILYPSAS
jgi:hypothetical protein